MCLATLEKGLSEVDPLKRGDKKEGGAARRQGRRRLPADVDGGWAKEG